MTKTKHIVYITTVSLIVFIVSITLIYKGVSYYNTGIEDRFYHEDHTALKPSGSWGHGYGILLSFFIAF